MVDCRTRSIVENAFPGYQTIYYKCKVCLNWTTESMSQLKMHIQYHSVVVVVQQDGKLKEIRFK